MSLESYSHEVVFSPAHRRPWIVVRWKHLDGAKKEVHHRYFSDEGRALAAAKRADESQAALMARVAAEQEAEARVRARHQEEVKSARELYRLACHGAGAEPRRAARAKLEAMIATDPASGGDLGTFMRQHGMDVAAYFASRPIG